MGSGYTSLFWHMLHFLLSDSSQPCKKQAVTKQHDDVLLTHMYLVALMALGGVDGIR